MISITDLSYRVVDVKQEVFLIDFVHFSVITVYGFILHNKPDLNKAISSYHENKPLKLFPLIFIHLC